LQHEDEHCLVNARQNTVELWLQLCDVCNIM